VVGAIVRLRSVKSFATADIISIRFLVYESYMNRRGGTGIAHDAHLWGALFGIGFMILVNPSFAMRFVEQVLGYFV